MSYEFRPFTATDLSMAKRWLSTPEVARWWGDPAAQLALLAEDLREPRMRQWIVTLRGCPFAYVQAYDAHAWPQPHLQALAAGSQVLDTFVGEPDMLGCGHGSRYLRQFAGGLLADGAPLVATDPDARNLRARRAYARAGFLEQATLETEGGRVVLMVRR